MGGAEELHSPDGKSGRETSYPVNPVHPVKYFGLDGKNVWHRAGVPSFPNKTPELF
jgi:hypothetical protein